MDISNVIFSASCFQVFTCLRLDIDAMPNSDQFIKFPPEKNSRLQSSTKSVDISIEQTKRECVCKCACRRYMEGIKTRSDRRDERMVMYVADGLRSPECDLADSPAFVPVQETVAALQPHIRRHHPMHSLGVVVRSVCRWYFFEPLMHRLHVASKAGRG